MSGARGVGGDIRGRVELLAQAVQQHGPELAPVAIPGVQVVDEPPIDRAVAIDGAGQLPHHAAGRVGVPEEVDAALQRGLE